MVWFAGSHLLVPGSEQGAARHLLEDGVFVVGTAGALALIVMLEVRRREETRADRDAVEVEVRASHRQITDLQKALDEHSIVAITDPSGRILFANDKFCEISGYSREELLGRDHRIVNSGNHPKEFVREMWRTIGSGKVWHGEFCNRAKDGRRYWVQTTIVPFLGDDGKPRSYVSLRNDISAEKATQRRLRDRETEYREVVETIRDVFWVRDVSTGRLVFVSPRFAEVWGRSPAGLSLERWLEYLHPEDRDRVEAAARAGLAEAVEYRIVRPDGTIRWIRDQAFEVREEGRLVRLVGTARDITGEKDLEEKFLRAQRLEAIGSLAGGIAHDLNNILAPILMVSGLLRHKLTDKSDGQMLDLLEGGAKRGAAMIRQMLSFSRGLGGQRVSVQLRHLAKEVAAFLTETFPPNVLLRVEAPADLPPVKGDPTQLHQVLMNLCVNARDAMPHGGRITLALRVENGGSGAARPPIPAGRFVLIEVADTGTGISHENLPRIFDPFFTTKGPEKGTGLGLATVMAITKGHGGFVDVQSEVGRGTKFSVYLPEATLPTVSVPPVIADSPSGHAEVILVVDDEKPIRESTRMFLERNGYAAITAQDGQEALRRYLESQERVRAVVLDLAMAGMDGLALARALRRIDPLLPMIVVSGTEAEDAKRELAALGVTAFLAKPCAPAELLQLLGRAVAPTPHTRVAN